ncbi:hypothetical protein M0L63_RS05425 [Providencia rettgeri]|uniref:hypothetical protein n=1 Tax=Providencia TaxID=586 RepID=UPI000D001532|nr:MULTISPECIES: hypothetical protein [Providencia]AVL74606.1 hypothetical protein CEQ08_13115 [Providencia rettgeri]EJD6582135.1 hypothetical protein [Providencia rettgeri]MBN6363449.1 hypothetical protein [Providencia huaxiensis]MBQ0262717.1 hypothetical protein [Providencia rettgeri]
MADSQSVGGIHYDVDMNIEGLVGGGKAVEKELTKLEKGFDGASKGIARLDKAAMAVSNSLKMPELNRLSRDMAQLSGKMGANSIATDKAMQSHNRFTGVLSTVSSQLSAGYIGNVGSATASLINHTKAALEATQAELANAEANKKQAETYQASAAQMVLNAKEEKAAAQSAIELAKDKVAAADSLTISLEKQRVELEQQVKVQRQILRDAKETYKIAPKDENFQDVVVARNKMMATEKKIQAIGNQIDKEQVSASQALKKAKEAEIAASAKVTAATALEQKAKATLATANEAVATASAKATAATKAQAIAMNGLRGVMALLGGPTGLFLLAAAGVYALYEAMTDDTAIKEYNAKIDEMITKIDSLTSKQAEVVSRELGVRIAKTKEELVKSVNEVKKLEGALERMNAIPNKNSDVLQSIKLATKQLGEYNLVIVEGTRRIREQEAQRKQLNKVEADRKGLKDERVDAMNIFNDAAKGAIESNKMLAKTIELGSPALAKMEMEVSALELSLSAAGISSEEAETQISNLKQTLEAGRADSFELMLQGIEENVQALKIEMEEGKDAAIEYLATVQMAKAGVSDDGMLDRLISGLRKQHELQTQISNGKKKGSGGKKDKAGDELKRQQNEVAALNKRFELLSTGVADANRDMAMFEAVQKLGAKATDKQKEATEKEAAEIYDLTQKVNDFIQAQEATPELKLAREFGEEAKTIRRMFDEGFIDKETFTRLGREATQAFEQGMSDIRIETTSNNIITDIGENRAKFDPIQALDNENTRKLAMMKEYYDQEQKLLDDSYAKQQMTHEQYTAAKSATDMQYHLLITAMDKQYQQQQLAAQWELMRQQNLGYEMLASAVDSLAGNASNVITGLMTGTMSAADAMRSLGNTILNSVVNSIVQVGVEMLKNFIIEQTIGKASQVANALAAKAGGAAALAAWTPAAIAASIATGGAASATGLGAFQASMLSGQALSIGLAGARYNGGPVKGGSAYELGEKNLPELMQIGNKLIGIPGNNGRVFSYDEITGAPVIPKAPTGKQYLNHKNNERAIQNKDLLGTGNGGASLQVIIENHVANAAIEPRMEKGLTGEDVARIIITDMNEKGPIHRSVINNTTAGPKL